MPANNKHMTVDGFIDVLGDLQDKADGRFAQGGGIIFSAPNNTLAAEDAQGNSINFPGGGGGGADVPLSVVNGEIVVTYEDDTE